MQYDPSDIAGLIDPGLVLFWVSLILQIMAPVFVIVLGLYVGVWFWRKIANVIPKWR